MARARKYWIVKHGLDAFQGLPHRIWRTGQREEPSAFKKVKKGDRWISFAYTSSDSRERSLSLVTGFSECIAESDYEPIPVRIRRRSDGRQKNAWFIKGRFFGRQPRHPVGVPAIEELLGRSYYRQTTLVNITHEEFGKIQREVREREFDPALIPALGREPRNEQEVVAIMAAAQNQLGIEKFIRIRTAFPDVLVKLKGKAEPVHLELELYSKSYLAHGHGKQMTSLDHYSELIDGQTMKHPVAILCWIHDADERRLRSEGKVSRVFELQSLVRDARRIRWA